MADNSTGRNIVKSIYQLATVALMIFGFLYFYDYFYKNSGSTTQTSVSEGTTVQGTTVVQIPKIGTPFNNGQFRIVVRGFRCGLTSIGNANLGGTMQPQGQFCSVSVTATNVSKTPAEFDDDTDTGFDPSGRQFTASATADIYGNESTSFAGPDGINGSSVNPTFFVAGNIYFDIPKGDTLTRIEIQTANTTTMNLYSTTVSLTH